MIDATQQKSRPDFAQVRLTDAGRILAGAAGTLTIVTGTSHYTFHGSDATEVLVSEWKTLFSKERAGNDLVFELTPAAPAVAAAAEHTESEA